jgi:hypothetical protein
MKKCINAHLNEDDKWTWLINDDFKSPRCWAAKSVEDAVVHGLMSDLPPVECDFDRLYDEFAPVAAEPTKYPHEARVAAFGIGCGARQADSVNAHEVTISGPFSLDWATKSKGNPKHVKNETQYPAEQMMELYNLIREVVEARHKTNKKKSDANKNLNTAANKWLARQHLSPTLRKLKHDFDDHFAHIVPPPGSQEYTVTKFTMHDCRQVYGARMCQVKNIHPRWHTVKISGFLGHAGLSGNGVHYAFIQHCPTPATTASVATSTTDDDMDSEIGEVETSENDNENDKENVVTRAAKRFKWA